MVRTLLPIVFLLGLACPCFAQNVHWGLLHGNLGIETGLEYTDNLNNNTNDVNNVYWLCTPTFDGGIDLPINIGGDDGEQMSIHTGLSYDQKYSLNGNKSEGGFHTPATANVHIPLSFGEWKIEVDERFSYQNDLLNAAFALNQAQSKQANNALTAALTRSFGKASITVAGSREDLISFTDPNQDTTTYQVSFTLTLLIRDAYSIFWSSTYALTYMTDPKLQDSEGYSSSIGVSGQITPYLNGVVSVGFAHTHLKETVLGPGTGIFGGIFDRKTVAPDNTDGITSSIGLSYSHPLNPYTTYSFSAFNSPGVTALLRSSSITEVYGMGLNITHQLTPKVALSPSFTYTHAQTVGRSSSGEVTDLFSVRLSLQRSISEKLRASVDYSYSSRFSSLPGSTYDRNDVSVRLIYTF